MLFTCGYNEQEWARFTKTQRKILVMVHELGFDRLRIEAALEIAPETLRGHMANIRRTQAMIRVEQATRQTEEQRARYQEKYLPDALPKEPLPVAPERKTKTLPFVDLRTRAPQTPEPAPDATPLSGAPSAAPAPTSANRSAPKDHPYYDLRGQPPFSFFRSSQT